MACLKSMFMVVLVFLYHSGVTSSQYDIPPECEDKMICDVKPSFYDKYQNDINEKFKPIQELPLLSTASGKGRMHYSIYEQKPSEYDEFQMTMEIGLKENKDFLYFTPRKVDDYEIIGGEDSHCQWISKVEQPYYVSNGITKHLIVQLKNFEQKIRTTRCTNKECGNIIGLEQFNMKAICVEKYKLIPFYIYDNEAKKIRHHFAQVPVCCTCGVENIN